MKFSGTQPPWFVGHIAQWATLLGSVFCGVLGSVYLLFGFFVSGGRLLVLCAGIGLLWWYVRWLRLRS